MLSARSRRSISPTATAARFQGSCKIGCIVVALGALLSISLPALQANAAAAPAFVQTQAKESNSGSTNSLAFTSANTAGNLIVVYVIWSNTNPVTLSDSRGNTYASAIGAIGSAADVLYRDVRADVALLEDRGNFLAVLQGGVLKAGRLA